MKTWSWDYSEATGTIVLVEAETVGGHCFIHRVAAVDPTNFNCQCNICTTLPLDRNIPPGSIVGSRPYSSPFDTPTIWLDSNWSPNVEYTPWWNGYSPN